MTPVVLDEMQTVQELFIEEADVASKQEMVDENLVLVLSEDQLDLEESIIDNILLAIPLQVLTETEKESQTLPTGEDWAVLTEEQYQAQQKEKAKDNSPFAGLQGLFDE
ncbi:putative cytoplasmic protein [Streptococcus equi subsp. zooepidemicus SzAM60]|nr:putative cytoplasmic protein [Streptococcus equi subsp. zooepidemicus SzAM60]